MAKILLLTASALAALLGVAHSYLGERYILIRLFRRPNLPKLFGSHWFTKRTLRFAWHLTTIAWWGLAAILTLAAFASGPEFQRGTLIAVAITFLVGAVVAAASTRGRHLSWIVFSIIAVLTLLAIR